jgi:transposase
MPHLAGLRVKQVVAADDGVYIDLRKIADTGRCPRCRRPSRRVHSHYTRRIADLPIADRAVVLRLRVRRFRCSASECSQRIFAEQVPGLAGRRARRSLPLLASLREVGFALGGRPGVRLGSRLRLPASRSTLLRLVRTTPLPASEPPRVLGVDDWAWRRGQRYGSILVDLERHRPVDLLSDRTAESLATWLREHPGIDVISRDRAGAYADGARQGAPDAVQVADRFHLLANVGELLERVLGGRRTALRQAAAAVDRAMSQSIPPETEVPATSDAPPGRIRAQERQQERRAQRLARYDAVVALHQQGHSHAAISRQMGLGRRTVRHYLRAGAFPERAAPSARPTMLAPYEPYLRTRWMAGCHNAYQLWREIHGRGFPGQPANVRRYVAQWRPKPGRSGPPARKTVAESLAPTPPARQPTPVPSPRQARWLLLRATDTLTPEERTYRVALLDAEPAIREAQQLAADFGALVRTRDGPGLTTWLDRADASGLPEIRSFSAGIHRDRSAVDGALGSVWSNGQTEGQINRLKALKRQMYGRQARPAGETLPLRRLTDCTENAPEPRPEYRKQ